MKQLILYSKGDIMKRLAEIFTEIIAFIKAVTPGIKYTWYEFKKLLNSIKTDRTIRKNKNKSK